MHNIVTCKDRNWLAGSSCPPPALLSLVFIVEVCWQFAALELLNIGMQQTEQTVLEL